MESRAFQQVDVFTATALKGNPVAVVLEADGMTAEQMADFSTWTNLSESTFFVPPKDPSADYAIRIFSHRNELPFAGHPTLGSAHAWLASGGIPRGERIRQECGIGIVEIQNIDETLFFAAPPLIKSGPLKDAELDALLAGLGITRDDVLAHSYLDNGPPWHGLLLKDAELVKSIVPIADKMRGQFVGLAGAYPAGSEFAFEIRAFFETGHGIAEDPITGSLNAGFGVWLTEQGIAADNYRAQQGTAVGRQGEVSVFRDETGQVWVGGQCHTVVIGELLI
jgi:PhzF family phenazine biosynthesis protein